MSHEPTLRSAIVQAFSGGPRPSPNDRIAINGVEGERLSKALSGRAWEELSLADLKVVPGSVLLLTPVAFKYFLPAYMLACIDDYRKAGGLVDSLVSKFIDPHLGIIPLDALRGLKTDSAKAISPAELDQIKQGLIRELSDPVYVESQHSQYVAELSLLSSSQLDAVIRFVEWLIAEHAADDILGDYRRAQLSLLTLRR